MEYSNQIVVSDGTLQLVSLTFPYIDKVDVHVSVDFGDGPEEYAPGTIWDWVGSEAIRFNEPLPDGAVAQLQRQTEIGDILNKFTLGAMFNAPTLDENFDQLLYIAQEYSDVREAAGKSIRVPSTEAPVAALPGRSERAGKLVAFDHSGEPEVRQDVRGWAVRASPEDVQLVELPSAEDRANKVLTFDSAGQPKAAFPASDSATGVRTDLADINEGAAMVAYAGPGGAEYSLADLANPDKGAAMVAYGATNIKGFLDARLRPDKIVSLYGRVAPDDDANPVIAGLTDAGYSVDLAGGTYTLKTPGEWKRPVFDSTGEGTLLLDFDANPAVTISQPDAAPHGFTVDMQNRNCVRFIRVQSGAHRSAPHSITFKNVSSLTFHRTVEISNDNVLGFDCYALRGIEISATANGTIGDNNGSCRLVYVGGAASVSTPSSGKIHDIEIDGLFPREDGDAVHVNSIGNTHSIQVYNINAKRVAKRAVKIQADGVDVWNITAEAIGTSDSMYSIVSHYGATGSVRGVRGRGWIVSGVDTDNGSISVRDVELEPTVTTPGGGVFMCAGGSPDAEDIRAIGAFATHIAYVRTATASIGRVRLRGVTGTSTQESILIALTGGRGAQKIDLGDIEVKTLSATANALAVSSVGGGVIDRFVGAGLDLETSGYFSAANIISATEVELDGVVTGGATSAALSVQNAQRVTSTNLRARSGSRTFALSNCTNTVTRGIRAVDGSTNPAMTITGGDNHVYTDVVVNGVGTVPVTVQSGATNVIAGAVYNLP